MWPPPQGFLLSPRMLLRSLAPCVRPHPSTCAGHVLPQFSVTPQLPCSVAEAGAIKMEILLDGDGPPLSMSASRATMPELEEQQHPRIAPPNGEAPQSGRLHLMGLSRWQWAWRSAMHATTNVFCPPRRAEILSCQAMRLLAEFLVERSMFKKPLSVRHKALA